MKVIFITRKLHARVLTHRWKGYGSSDDEWVKEDQLKKTAPLAIKNWEQNLEENGNFMPAN